MLLDYGALLCPDPIKLSIGSLKKPTLREIYAISFDRFSQYEAFLKMTPESFYNGIQDEEKQKYWESLSDAEKSNISMYSIIVSDDKLQEIYAEVFDFFFLENVIYKDGYFLILNDGVSADDEITVDDLSGIISEKTFQQIVSLIQQTCCIYERSEAVGDIKFKNKTARKIHEKILKAQKEQAKQKAGKVDKNYLLPNIISAVSNRHPDMNPISIWDLTVFQLIDSFNRLQANAVYDINQTRVSVWGDEKKTFDSTLWYKNNNDY